MSDELDKLDIEDSPAFNRGDEVPDDSQYVCVPCGFKHEYKKGEKFGECMSCLAGTPQGEQEYAEGMEMWEKL